MKKATIITARNMSEETLETIKCGVVEKFGAETEFEHIFDETVIGGFIINIDGTVYDMSVKTQLNEIKKHIKG